MLCQPKLFWKKIGLRMFDIILHAFLVSWKHSLEKSWKKNCFRKRFWKLLYVYGCIENVYFSSMAFLKWIAQIWAFSGKHGPGAVKSLIKFVVIHLNDYIRHKKSFNHTLFCRTVQRCRHGSTSNIQEEDHKQLSYNAICRTAPATTSLFNEGGEGGSLGVAGCWLKRKTHLLYIYWHCFGWLVAN